MIFVPRDSMALFKEHLMLFVFETWVLPIIVTHKKMKRAWEMDLWLREKAAHPEEPGLDS